MTMNIMSMRVQAGTETGAGVTEGDNSGKSGRFADVLMQQTDSGKNATPATANPRQPAAEALPDDVDIAALEADVQDEGVTSAATSSSQDETADNRDAKPENTSEPAPSLSSLSATISTTPISAPSNMAAEPAPAGERSTDDTAGDAPVRPASMPTSAKTTAGAALLSDIDTAPAAKAETGNEAEAEGSDAAKGALIDATDSRRRSGVESLTDAGRSTTTTEQASSSRQESGSQLPPATATKADRQALDARSPEQIPKSGPAVFEGASGQAAAPVTGAREPVAPAPQAVENPDVVARDEVEGRAVQKQAERTTAEATAASAASRSESSRQSETVPAASRPKITVEVPPPDTRRDTANSQIANSQAADSLANKDAVAVRQQEATSARPPEWLAQIEHGRRWSQPDLRAGSPMNTDDNGNALPSVDLAEGDGEQESRAKPVSTASNMPEPAPASLLSSQSGGDGAPAMNQAAVGQDAGLAVVNRDGIQAGSTAERPVLADRVVTLQQGAPEQSAKQLSQQVQVMVSQNLQEADIRLDPSNLGGLRIQVKMEQGEVQVQFLASHPQARELLDQALPRLRDMLSQQGLNLSQNQGQSQSGSQQGGFNQAAQQDGQQQSQQNAQQGGEGRSHGPRGYGSLAGDEPQTSLAGEARLSNRSDDAGRIDFFA
ncbi:flagellar hook-length control protein FliK [uncultured Oceanisphaera sp.]|uniref:flagellar hook-length control protein FliK n=1 Tax=uncultured Oceanisphaera sp. TaxID=353858 RepID=UPI00261BF21E|nr:flagellar hook-length control protein FliK [uncultured Oceanisphaera sp.]